MKRLLRLPVFGRSLAVMSGRSRVDPRLPLVLLLAGVLGLGLPLLLLGPDLHEQRQAQLRRAQELDSARLQAAGPPPAAPVASEADLMATAEQASAGASWVPADRLVLYRTALRLGLTVQELKGPAPADPPPRPVAASAKSRGLAQTALNIELRGPFEALGRFVTALGRSSAPAWRLLRLELLAGPSAQHRLLLQLEPLPPGAPKLDRRPGSRLPTFSVAHDPFVPVASKPPVMQPSDSAPQGEILATASPSPPPMPLPWKLELDRPAQPLEAFALRDLFLTGTLRQGSLWLALVRAGGVIHTLRQGEYAGQDLGLVQSVDEEGLELREIVRDGNGHWAESLRRWSVGTRP